MIRYLTSLMNFQGCSGVFMKWIHKILWFCSVLWLWFVPGLFPLRIRILSFSWSTSKWNIDFYNKEKNVKEIVNGQNIEHSLVNGSSAQNIEVYCNPLNHKALPWQVNSSDITQSNIMMHLGHCVLVSLAPQSFFSLRTNH
jgi:hypothetical protein